MALQELNESDCTPYPPVLALSRHNGQRPEVLNTWAMDGGEVQRPGHYW